MKIFTQWRRHPLLSALLVAEGLVVAFLLLRCFRPVVTQQFTGNQFIPTGLFPVMDYGEAGRGVNISGDQEADLLMSLETYLPSGAYDVVVEYESVLQPEAPSHNLKDSTGWLDFSLNSDSRALLANSVPLTDGAQTASGRLWLKLGAGSQPLSLQVEYAGTGSLVVHSVTLSECSQYRAARVLGALALFALLDLGVLLFSGISLSWLPPRRKYILLGLGAITLLSSLLFTSPFLYVCREGTDLTFHLNRIESLAQAILDGQIPQRIQPEMLNGYGYTNPLFYGELFLVFPALLLLLAVPVQTVYQILVFAMNFATAALTWWCLDRVTRDWKKSLFGSAIYTLASYRMLKTLIWRNAVGECLAALFLLLVLYGFYHLYMAEEEKRLGLRDCLPLIIGLTGLIQSHILSCELVAFFAVPFLLIFWKKTFQPRRFLALAKTAVITFLLNAWFLIPFLQSYLSMDLKVSSRNPPDLAYFSLGLHQILTLFPFPFDSWGTEFSDQMLLSVGPALVIGLFSFLVYCIKRETFPRDRREFIPMAFCFGMGSAALFLASRYFPWGELSRISPLLYQVLGVIQYPWRFLGMAIPFLTLGTVLLLQAIERHLSPKLARGLLFLMLGLCVFVTSCFYSVAADRMGTLTLYTLDEYDRMDVVQGEYLPTQTDPSLLGDRTILTGTGVTARELERQGVRSLWECENSSSADSYLDLPLLAYHNYQATGQDGSSLALSTGENGRIRVTVPGGYEGVITVEYREPALWRVWEGVSLVTLAGCIGVLVRPRKKPLPSRG